MRALLFLVLAASLAAVPADIRLVSDFKAPPDNVRAVLESAGSQLWRHCPDVQWAGPGIDVFWQASYPVTAYDPSKEGRIRIGVTTRGAYWSQFAFQFSHEMAHALAGHTRHDREPWIRGPKANMWLEESLGETASLFALRAMGREWATQPPYPNWKDYGASLTSYAQQRLDESAKTLAPDQPFLPWLAKNEAAMRASSVIRESNNVVAARLLPLFERTPSGWEAVTYLNLGRRRDPQLSLADHLADWQEACPPKHRPFVRDLAAILGVRLR